MLGNALVSTSIPCGAKLVTGRQQNKTDRDTNLAILVVEHVVQTRAIRHVLKNRAMS